MFGRWTLLGLAGWLATASGRPGPGPCEELYHFLVGIPHDSIAQREGQFRSTWNGEVLEGCEIEFRTTMTLLGATPPPDLEPTEETALYRAGWRAIPEILADGAGSGVYGLRRGDVRCVVRWEQPAYIDESGQLVQSGEFSLHLQCDQATGADDSASSGFAV